MPARMLRFIFMVCLVVGTTGCGFAVLFAGECRNEAPTPAARNFFPNRHDGSARPPWPTKSVFLDAWGRPDRIERTSEECEIWVYDKKLWCGVIPILVAPVPLVLPACDGFDRIEFRNDTARVLHTRRALVAGFFVPPGTSGTDPACRNPIPLPLRERIRPGHPVSVSVSIDTPEHQDDVDYREVSGLVRDSLIPALAQTGIFTEILSAPESADYRLEVVVTTAEIRRRVFSWVNENRVVLRVQLTFRETGRRIGDFEVDRRSSYWRAGAGEVVRPSVEEIIRVLKDE